MKLLLSNPPCLVNAHVFQCKHYTPPLQPVHRGLRALALPPVSLHCLGCDASACKISNVTDHFAACQRGEHKQTPARPVCLPSLPGQKNKKGDWWLFSQMFCCPRGSPRWRWQRHSGIGCGRAWQASEASVLFLPGHPGTASQPAALQQPPN